MLARTYTTRAIRITCRGPQPLKPVVSLLEPTQLSSTSENYYLETNDVNVNVFDSTETEGDQGEESINTNELQSTADSSEQETNTERLFILILNNQRQQTSSYKKIISPAMIPGKDGNDTKAPVRKPACVTLFFTSFTPRVITHLIVHSILLNTRLSSLTMNNLTQTTWQDLPVHRTNKHIVISTPMQSKISRPQLNKTNKNLVKIFVGTLLSYITNKNRSSLFATNNVFICESPF